MSTVWEFSDPAAALVAIYGARPIDALRIAFYVDAASEIARFTGFACALGRISSHDMKWITVLLRSMDDVVDRYRIPATLDQLLNDPELGRLPEVQLFRRSVEELGLLGNTRALRVLEDIQRLQIESYYVQLGDNPYPSDVLRVTIEKGGLAGVFHLYVACPDADERRARALYLLGAMFQVLDDYADYYKDLHEGSKTMFTIGAWGFRDLVRLARRVAAELRRLGFDGCAELVEHLAFAAPIARAATTALRIG